MLAKVSIPVISGKKIHMQQDLISCENVCWRADFAACRSPLSRAAVTQPNVVCSTAGCPKVSPGVAECLLFMIWHFKIVFTPAYCSGPAIVSEVVWLSIFRFKIIECYDQLPISFLSHELMEQLQVWLVLCHRFIDFEQSSPVNLLILLCFFFFNTIYLFNQCIHSLLTVRQLVCRDKQNEI